ncbi:hypothetical protein [Litoribacillus peritrichatus]|uniref:Uncharacterized protein n=1 Tax=Litoribacillus peritrichatus TaxID=718191 RepID=A0ABP7MKW3_9GAMM
MKVITSTLFAMIFASFATVTTASEVTGVGFTDVDKANPVCPYGKRTDRKRDLDCAN